MLDQDDRLIESMFYANSIRNLSEQSAGWLFERNLVGLQKELERWANKVVEALKNDEPES